MRSLVFLLLAVPALAGGGPETTLLVVNARSPASQLIAHEYAQLRDIPANHVLTLAAVPDKDVLTIEEFLAHVWTPIDAYLKKSGLAGQIDCIAYSAGFPYAVNFRSRVPGFAQLNKQQRMIVGGQASLNGATYLIEQVLKDEPFWDLSINRYYRPVSLTGRARNQYFRAQGAMRQKQYAIAASAFQELFRTFPYDPSSWYNHACCLALLNRKKEALDALEEAAKRGFNGAAHAAQDPDLASVRGDARFAPILASMRTATPPAAPVKPTRGFASARDWDGSRYILSVHLAHTGRFGNSVPEVLAYLRAAKAADGTRPAGTVYFLKNKNVRSTTREPQWAATAAALKARGRAAELLDGVLPQGKPDVLGAIVGSAGFKWAASKSKLLPGSIAEHLTSFGAHFGTPGQTKISEFLRYGAAGSSGTVMEPLAIANKFPHGLMHAFYADGCSLAEAFYQSVQGPYQLMIVGDPLARPFATFQKVTVDAPRAPWKGEVTLAPKVDRGKARFEYWIDGVRRGEGETFSFDGRGVHDVRVVAVADDPIETRSYVKLTSPASPAATPLPSETVVTDSLPGTLPGMLGFAVTGKQRRPFVVQNVGDRHGGRRLVDELGKGSFDAVELHGRIELPAGFHELHFVGRGKLTLAKRTVDVDGRWTFAFTTKEAGAWPLSLAWKPKGAPGLEILLGGSQPLGPPRVVHAAPQALKKPPRTETAYASLIDAKRDGPGAALRYGTLELTWKSAVKGIEHVTLFPGKGAVLPAEWTVEYSLGSRKWKPVEDFHVLVARPAHTVKDEPEAPVFVQLSFGPIRAKKLRLFAKGGAVVSEVEIAGRRELPR